MHQTQIKSHVEDAGNSLDTKVESRNNAYTGARTTVHGSRSMTSTTLRSTDRVQAFLAAIDIHEPTLLEQNEDLFRIFAQASLTFLDGRYLDRHPPKRIDPSHRRTAGYTSLFREPDEIKVSLQVIDDGSDRRGALITCLPDQPFFGFRY